MLALPLALSHFNLTRIAASPLIEAWRFWALWLVGLVTAWFTNPNEASFKTYLTDLSFQQHLRRLRTSSAPDGSPPKDSHVLTFTNRVSINFRTPQYKLHSFGLFSTVTMAASLPDPRHRCRKVDSAKGQEEGCILDHKADSLPAVFVGAFGRWWAWEDAEYTQLATKQRLSESVLSMEALNRITDIGTADDINDSEDSASVPGDPKPARTRKTHPVKATFRAGQRRASPTVKSLGKSSRPTLPEPVKLSSDPATPPAASAPETQPLKTQEDASAELQREEETLHASVAHLKQQIAQLEQSSQSNHTQLQGELDDCRARKRDEEHHRTDVKSKARTLEEAKRQAEVEFSEAERRHATAKTNKQQLTDRIERMKAELGRLDRKEADFKSKQVKSRADREQREAELLPQLRFKKEEMSEQEIAISKLVARVEMLESEIEERKTDLSHRREAVLRRNHSQRHFMPTHYVPIMTAADPTSPSTQWAPYREFQGQPVNSSHSSSNNFVLSGQSTPGSPDSPSSGFLEHRRLHQQSGDGSQLPSRTSSLRIQRSKDSISDFYTGFAPFGPPASTMPEPETAVPAVLGNQQGARNVSLPFFMSGGLTSLDGSNEPSTPAGDGALSPMTPNQASLIPAHLFDMLDNDEDDPVPQTPLEVALPMRQNIWSDEAAQEAFNRAGNAVRAEDELTLNRVRSNDSSRTSSLYSAPSPQMSRDMLARHPLSLNPGAKAFSPDALSEHASPPSRRSLFGSSSLRDVWSRASNKTDHKSAAETAALFDADDSFLFGAPMPRERARSGD